MHSKTVLMEWIVYMAVGCIMTQFDTIFHGTQQWQVELIPESKDYGIDTD